MSASAELAGTLQAAAVVVGLVCAGLIVWFALRGLRAADPAGDPATSASPRALLVVGAATALTLALLFVWGLRAWIDLRVPPDHIYEIQVEAARGGWTFRYPEGTCGDVGELVLPLATPVRLALTSRDVTHDLFLPSFRLQREAVPGRSSSMWLEAPGMGTYPLRCAASCGAGSADRSGTLRVLSVHEMKKWIAGGCGATNLPPRELGARLFRQRGCSTCHSTTAERKDLAGPPLGGLVGKRVTTDRGETVADDAYLRQSIVDPTARIVSGYQPVMPQFKGLLDDRQVDALLGYIRSLN